MTDERPLAIETIDLRKSFGETVAVDGIDLQIPRGTVYGLLGPNGAGKTTIIRLLATLLRPNSGTATVLGHDVVKEAAAVREKVSLTGQYASIDEDLLDLLREASNRVDPIRRSLSLMKEAGIEDKELDVDGEIYTINDLLKQSQRTDEIVRSLRESLQAFIVEKRILSN